MSFHGSAVSKVLGLVSSPDLSAGIPIALVPCSAPLKRHSIKPLGVSTSLSHSLHALHVSAFLHRRPSCSQKPFSHTHALTHSRPLVFLAPGWTSGGDRKMEGACCRACASVPLGFLHVSTVGASPVATLMTPLLKWCSLVHAPSGTFPSPISHHRLTHSPRLFLFPFICIGPLKCSQKPPTHHSPQGADAKFT